METEITLQIILVKPTKDVDFGLQKGSGNDYETIQKQRSDGQDLFFKFPVKIKGEKKICYQNFPGILYKVRLTINLSILILELMQGKLILRGQEDLKFL